MCLLKHRVKCVCALRSNLLSIKCNGAKRYPRDYASNSLGTLHGEFKSSLWAPVPVRTPPTPRTQRAHVPKLVSMWDKEAKTRMRFFVCLFDDIFFKNMLHTSDEQH